MLKVSTEALEYFPSEPLFYYFNGASNKWFKNYDDAIKYYEKALEYVKRLNSEKEKIQYPH